MTAEAIQLTAKLYEVRTTCRQLLGTRYHEVMSASAEVINVAVERTGADVLTAAIEIAKRCSSPYAQMHILAAAVELVEPSIAPATAVEFITDSPPCQGFAPRMIPARPKQ